MRETRISAKQALKISRKHALYRTWILQSVGEYYWLAGKQSKALSWWNKTIKEGKAPGAKMDLSLAYFEVGKRLMESHSKHKEMNGIDGRGFLEKARILFEEIGLKRNLGELERIDRVLERLVYSLSKRFIELRPTKLFWFPSNCSDLVNSGGGQKNGIPFQLDIITKVEYAPDW